jgi:tRNA pseudouridine13 synthase
VNELPGYESLSRAWGDPPGAAIFKQTPQDFHVEEELGFQPGGGGEHLCLRIQKTGISTRDALKELSRITGVREADIGYAGQKDRQGVCIQWFSVRIPGGSEPDLTVLDGATLRVLGQYWNSRKIRLGTHRANRFRIRLRELSAPQESVVERAAVIAAEGVPNYFGEQRFGRNEGNLQGALDWFAGRSRPGRYQRSMLLSAARSAVFNAVLSRRVQAGNWQQHLPGDVMNLAGSDSVFVADPQDKHLDMRLKTFDIHPTGPLWGRGELLSSADCLGLELQVATQYSSLCEGLVAHGLKQQRRSLRLLPQQMEICTPEPRQLEITFSLPPGCFATAVLRELCRYTEVRQ